MIDILVPVLGRPANAAPLAESARVTESPYNLVFVCSPDDPKQISACLETGERTLIASWPAGPGDFAKKINWAFTCTESEWVFQGADDIRFRDGWDTAALEVARRTRASVIGTNDLHNPAVKRRLHSTHTLFRRDYIERYGGTVDGSGLIFCEHYDHQFVDNEFVETAMLRRQWAFAQDAIVEHLHPYFGLASYDDTYLKALRASTQDQELYRARSRKFRNKRYTARR